MGCDGGTIPRRDELVRLKKKPELKDKIADTAAKWKNCALSQEPLREPIIACELGRLYNKESVIEHLLNKDSVSPIAGHIRNLKDVMELKTTANKDFDTKVSNNGDSYIDMQRSRYICPVAGIEMNGIYKFCILWKCGCVISERALQAVKSESCHKCGQVYDKNDIVVLNGNDQEVEEMRANMEARREKTKMEKKSKKAAKGKRSPVATDEKSETSRAKMAKKEPSTIRNVNVKLTKNDSKKIQPGYSIASDPSASKTLKSIFTTHESAKNKGSAHWVTYNPFYN